MSLARMVVLSGLKSSNMDATNITIRPATLADANLAAVLIYLTMGIEADWLFGQEPGFSTQDVLTGLYKRRNNRASHQFAYMATLAGQDVGLLLAYPGRLLKRLDWMTGLHLVQIFGLPATIRVAQCQHAYANLVESDADEFYISNVAVKPEYQGLGVGKALMQFAEHLAHENSLRKCSLIVTYGHEPARRLYEKIGYEIVCPYDINHPQVAEGSGGYHRMVKVLPPN